MGTRFKLNRPDRRGRPKQKIDCVTVVVTDTPDRPLLQFEKNLLRDILLNPPRQEAVDEAS